MAMVISQPISTFTQRYFNHIHFFTYIFIEYLRFSIPILGMHYQKPNSMGNNSHVTRTTSSAGVTRYLNQFQLSLHKIIIMTTFSHIHSSTHFTFSVENLGQVLSNPQDQRKCSGRTRKRTHLPCECHIMIT